ncbi:MAG: response regulator [Opitutaceae bacterium]|nr:response regulator [Opitutaceae bacterium]
MPDSATVLIVDDEAHVRTYVRMLLKELGIESCWEAANGTEVLPLVAEHNPRLVLLDLNMPGTDGLKVLAQLAEAHPDLPVAIMTTQNSIESVNEAVRLGACAFILKHKPRPQVLAELRELIDSLGDGEDE